MNSLIIYCYLHDAWYKFFIARSWNAQWLTKWIYWVQLYIIAAWIEGSPYSSQVEDEAVSAVEAGPAEWNLGGPDHPSALDVQQSLGWNVIGDNVVEPRGHAPCLRSRGDCQQQSFPTSLYSSPSFCCFLYHDSFHFDWTGQAQGTSGNITVCYSCSNSLLDHNLHLKPLACAMRAQIDINGISVRGC